MLLTYIFKNFEYYYKKGTSRVSTIVPTEIQHYVQSSSYIRGNLLSLRATTTFLRAQKCTTLIKTLVPWMAWHKQKAKMDGSSPFECFFSFSVCVIVNFQSHLSPPFFSCFSGLHWYQHQKDLELDIPRGQNKGRR